MFFIFHYKSTYYRGFACIERFKTGGDYRSRSSCCHVCNKWYDDMDNYFDKEIVAQIAKTKASKWPDIIANGHEPHFTIVSQKVLEVWESEGIGTFPCFPVHIQPPFPKTLITVPPAYYRLDYKKMIGAELDFEASGYVNAKICKVCGKFSFDISKTGNLERSKIIPFVLKSGTWSGKHVFCPTPQEQIICCTDKVVDCAHKYQLTDFEFCPFEIGHRIGFKGVDYSKKNWRLKLPEQIRKFEEDFQKQRCPCLEPLSDCPCPEDLKAPENPEAEPANGGLD